MNRIIIGFICLFTFQNVYAQFSLDHYQPVKLIAKEGIDTCAIFVINSDSSLTIEQSYIYNSMGLEIENRRDFQNFSFVYNYDLKGNKITEFFVPFGEGYYERDTFLYNKKGRLLKSITFNNDGTESKRNEYDYKRKLLIEERYILKANLQTRYIYYYDKNKRVSKIQLFFKGNHNEDWLHDYDTEGNLISFTTVSANGDTSLQHKFEYNNMGLRIKHSIFSKGKILNTVFKTEYNSIGLILWMETITNIFNNDPSTGELEKTIYKYTYR